MGAAWRQGEEEELRDGIGREGNITISHDLAK